MEKAAIKPLWKVASTYLIFMALYLTYRFIPIFPLSIIAATNESNFQHYKQIFFTLLIASGLEYFALKKAINDNAGFWYPRLLAAVLAPWLVFLIWYLAPALLGGPFPQIWQEILYANGVTIICFALTVIMEHAFLDIRYTRELRFVVGSLAVISVLLFMVFTFSHLPWADVFIEPKWH